MTTTLRSFSLATLAAALLGLTVAGVCVGAWAQEPPTQEPEASAPSEPPPPPDATDETDTAQRRADERDEDVANVRIGSKVHLGAGETADTVVSMFASVTSEGRAQDIIAIFGNARVTGPVEGSVTAVFGDAYIDSKVEGDAVVVFGDLELGHNADIGGDVQAVGGTIKRHPNAVIRGSVDEVSFGKGFGQLKWLRPWITHGARFGRPLALEPDLAWAWWLAGGFLALYVLLALLFRSGVEKCVTTFETRPGETVLASIVAIFLSPIFLLLMSLTVIGLMLVPFFLFAVFLATLFGKAVVLAVLGRRFTSFAKSGPVAHVAFATLLGGVIMTALYLVPFVGFLVQTLFGTLALGVVIYTLLLAYRDRTTPTPVAAPAAATTTAAALPIESATSTAETAASATESPSPAPAAEPAVPLNALPRADFWVRMGALAIDAVLVSIVINLVPGLDDYWLLSLATYGALMWKLKGTTVGGIICNLRVVRLDGREVDWATSIVRALSCFLSLVVVGLGFIWIAIDRDRQGWHDKIAGTVVVRVPKGTPLV